MAPNNFLTISNRHWYVLFVSFKIHFIEEFFNHQKSQRNKIGGWKLRINSSRKKYSDENLVGCWWLLWEWLWLKPARRPELYRLQPRYFFPWCWNFYDHLLERRLPIWDALCVILLWRHRCLCCGRGGRMTPPFYFTYWKGCFYATIQ